VEIVFAGTPEFAATHLKGLAEAGRVPVAVYCQPDRPTGRGRRVRSGPVKALARELGLPVHQPETLRDPSAQAELAALAPDLMVVVAYGLLLPPAVLVAPRRGGINVHASLLPRWRGAAPIQRALLAGDAETGVSVMQMEAGLDTGPVLHSRRCPIGPRETGASLHDRLAALGSAALVETLEALERGPVAARPKDDGAATYAPKLDKAEAEVRWREPAAAIDRQIRAFNPWPVATTRLGETVWRLWEAEPEPGPADAAPGTVVAAAGDAIRVATGDGVVAVRRLQLPGGRPVAARDYLNAHPSPRGRVLGG
jgi:methionyl-tRNA formyltransferase